MLFVDTILYIWCYYALYGGKTTLYIIPDKSLFRIMIYSEIFNCVQLTTSSVNPSTYQ